MPRSPRAAQLGVTADEYDRLLAAQGGHCALCPNTPKTRRLHVDHDHRTGEKRGLLCFPCNRALPYYKDSAWLRRAADYVDKYSGRGEDGNGQPTAPVPDVRLDEMRELRATGSTYADIAKRYGISRQRVHQLLSAS